MSELKRAGARLSQCTIILTSPPNSLNSRSPIYFSAANDIGDAGTKALATGMNRAPHLRMVDMCANLAGNEGATALASALETNSTLMKLNLSCTYLSLAGGRWG